MAALVLVLLVLVFSSIKRISERSVANNAELLGTTRQQNGNPSLAVLCETDAVFRLSAQVPTRCDITSILNQQPEKNRRDNDNSGREEEKEEREEEELVR